MASPFHHSDRASQNFSSSAKVAPLATHFFRGDRAGEIGFVSFYSNPNPALFPPQSIPDSRVRNWVKCNIVTCRYSPQTPTKGITGVWRQSNCPTPLGLPADSVRWERFLSCPLHRRLVAYVGRWKGSLLHASLPSPCPTMFHRAR